MGGLFHLPLVRTTHSDLSQWIQLHGMHLIGLSPDSKDLWTDFSMTSPVGLVVGEERRGVSDESRSLCDTMIRRSMTGRADSLNVGGAPGSRSMNWCDMPISCGSRQNNPAVKCF